MATAQTTPRLDVRADFPIFRREFGGRPLVYLDSAATSQKPESVIEAMDDYYRFHNANIHRGVYALAQEATDMFEGARGARGGVQRLGGRRRRSSRGTRPRRSTSSPTRGDASTSAPATWCSITQMEHHSNIVPWQLLCQERRRRAALPRRRRRRQPLARPARRGAGARATCKLVAFAHVSNVLGTINPVSEIAARVRAAGAVVAGRRRAGASRSSRSTWAPSASTSTPGPGTRRSGRPASASCTDAARCSRRCARSSAAAT